MMWFPFPSVSKKLGTDFDFPKLHLVPYCDYTGDTVCGVTGASSWSGFTAAEIVCQVPDKPPNGGHRCSDCSWHRGQGNTSPSPHQTPSFYQRRTLGRFQNISGQGKLHLWNITSRGLSDLPLCSRRARFLEVSPVMRMLSVTLFSKRSLRGHATNSRKSLTCRA